MVTGKFFRYELEQCKNRSFDHCNCCCTDFYAFQAYRSLSAGRSLCAEYGCQYKNIPGDTDSSVQRSFCNSNCLRRTYFFCGNSSPPSGKTGTEYVQTTGGCTWNFSGGAVFCMLSDLIARTAFAPLELNISTVTSIFGAPVVIGMMLKRQKGKQ